MKFNYGKLLPGMIIGTTNTFTLFGAIARVTETKNILNFLNPNISSHIFLITREHGLLNGVEMVYPKIRQCDLNEYENGCLGNHAVFIANPFGDLYIKNYELQEKVNKWILQCHSLGIKYGFLELFKFWDIPVPEDHSKIICSDLSRNMMNNFKLKYPYWWDEKNSPFDQQRYFKHNNMIVRDGIIM